MLYRFALALGLLFLGVHVGREISRMAPARARLAHTRTQRLVLVPDRKASLH